MPAVRTLTLPSRLFLLAGLLLALAALSGWAASRAEAKARAIKTIGPEGMKDHPAFAAVDPRRNRIYITNLGGDDGLGSNPDHLTVIDGRTDTVIKHVLVDDHPSGVDVDLRTGRIYVANANGHPIRFNPDGSVGGGGGTISVIDPNTLEVIDHTVVPPPPGSRMPITETDNPITGKPAEAGWPADVEVDQETGLLWVANAGENAGGQDPDCCFIPGVLSIYDPRKREWILGGSNGIPAGTSPISPVINQRTDRLYVTAIDSNTITVVNTKTRRVVRRLETVPEPYELGVDPAANRVYVGHFDQRAITSPSRGCPSCPDGVLPYRTLIDVIDGERNKLMDPFYGGSFTRNLAVNEKTGRVYVANLNTSSVSIVQDGKVVERVRIGLGPRAITVNPATNKIYVGNSAESSGKPGAPDGGPDSIAVIRDTPAIELSASPRRASVGESTCFTFKARHSHSGRPLRGAMVRFAGSRRRTDNKGRAEICQALGRTGKRSARATRRGFSSGRTSVLLVR